MSCDNYGKETRDNRGLLPTRKSRDDRCGCADERYFLRLTVVIVRPFFADGFDRSLGRSETKPNKRFSIIDYREKKKKNHQRNQNLKC